MDFNSRGISNNYKLNEDEKQKYTPNKDWREIVAWIKDLPPMPQVAAEAIKLVENPATTGQELGKLLGKDPALASRVLKIANSAMFSRQREITTLAQALMVIGFKALKGIIVAATLRQMNNSISPFSKLVWAHAMGTAIASNIIAKHFKKPYVDEVFLLGLLHNLGQVVILADKESSKQYKLVMRKIEDEGVDYLLAENEILGFCYPLIGALVAKKWNFPPNTCQIILHHADLVEDNMALELVEEQAVLVGLASCVAHLAGIGTPVGYPNQLDISLDMLKFFNVPQESREETLELLVQKTQEIFKEESSLYN